MTTITVNTYQIPISVCLYMYSAILTVVCDIVRMNIVLVSCLIADHEVPSSIPGSGQ